MIKTCFAVINDPIVSLSYIQFTYDSLTIHLRELIDEYKVFFLHIDMHTSQPDENIIINTLALLDE